MPLKRFAALLRNCPRRCSDYYYYCDQPDRSFDSNASTSTPLGRNIGPSSRDSRKWDPMHEVCIPHKIPRTGKQEEDVDIRLLLLVLVSLKQSFSTRQSMILKDQNTRDLLAWTIGNGDPMPGVCVPHSIHRA